MPFSVFADVLPCFAGLRFFAIRLRRQSVDARPHHRALVCREPAPNPLALGILERIGQTLEPHGATATDTHRDTSREAVIFRGEPPFDGATLARGPMPPPFGFKARHRPRVARRGG